MKEITEYFTHAPGKVNIFLYTGLDSAAKKV